MATKTIHVCDICQETLLDTLADVGSVRLAGWHPECNFRHNEICIRCQERIANFINDLRAHEEET